MAADHHSAHPNIAGIPWWGAVLTAVIASLVGFAFDAGSGGQQLTAVFSALYVIGCLVAVLAVQQAGLFTAVIQPPLVLFVTVPSAYFMMRSGEIDGIKDILINCGYPLIERFPLMFFTSAAVLLIGLARWYFGKSTGVASAERIVDPAPSARGGRLSSKLSSLLGGSEGPKDTATSDERPRQRRTSERRRAGAAKPEAGRTARAARPDRATSRSRNARAAEHDGPDPRADRPRRRRPRPGDEPSDSSVEPRRRPRPSASRDPRDPRDPVPPRERRSQYDRADRYEGQRPPRPQRRSRYDDYEPLDPYSTSTHHPISRVRYRGGDEVDDRPDYRTRRRAPRDVDADRWEYDI